MSIIDKEKTLDYIIVNRLQRRKFLRIIRNEEGFILLLGVVCALAGVVGATIPIPSLYPADSSPKLVIYYTTKVLLF